MRRDFITVVSGLPRSGTSMMMAALQAGGLEPLTDGARPADEDNPHGYYELEAVKRLSQDCSWLPQAVGCAVKIVSPLLFDLPADRPYRVVFLLRDLDEVLASQRRMLERPGAHAGGEDAGSDAEIRPLFAAHLEEVREWLAAQANARVLYVDYERAVADPVGMAAAVDRFLGGGLDRAAMAAAVDPTLQRQRRLGGEPA